MSSNISWSRTHNFKSSKYCKTFNLFHVTINKTEILFNFESMCNFGYSIKFISFKCNAKKSWNFAHHYYWEGNKGIYIPSFKIFLHCLSNYMNFRLLEKLTGTATEILLSVSNKFNDFFSLVADTVRFNSNHHFSNFLKHRNPNSLFLSPTTPEEVAKIIGHQVLTASLSGYLNFLILKLLHLFLI